jgi:chitin synthase
MAYRQNNDPYYASQQHTNNNHYAQYPAQGSATHIVDYPPHHGDYDGQANWDSKSAKSYQSSYAGSQAHLVPYEMSQVPPRAPPVPAMPYQQPNYPPPQQRPGLYSDHSSAGYSVAREKMMRRRSVRQVQLFQGNLVLDVQVPSHIVPAGKQDVEEMSKMRYTAATCDPDDFMSSRYSLRQYLMGRQTELFIVMTMYNEDEVLFVKTMNAWVLFNFNFFSLTLTFSRL